MNFVDSPWAKLFFISIGSIGVMLNLALLVVLLLCKNNMGEYRVLMGVYVFFSLGYSLFNLFVRPVMLINDQGWLLYGSGLPSCFNQLTGSTICALFCSFAAILLATLSFSYILRYLTICRTEGVKIVYQNISTSVTIALILFSSVAITGTAFLYLLPNEETKNAFEGSFYDTFQHNIDQAPYIAVLSYRNGLLTSTFALTFGIRMGMCIFSTVVMITCGCKIVRHLRLQADMMSDTAPFISKQRRLFSLLIVQSSVPILLFYLPFGVCIIFTILQWNIPLYSKIASLLLPISTVIDPVLIFFNVSQYRRFLYRKFGCQKLDNYRMKKFMALPALGNGILSSNEISKI